MSNKANSSALSSYVPTSRTINSKTLSANITLNASDIGLIVVDNLATTAANVNAGASITGNCSITKTGYTPIGIMSVQPTYGALLVSGAYIQSTNAKVKLYNNGTSAITDAQAILRVLYSKN